MKKALILLFCSMSFVRLSASESGEGSPQRPLSGRQLSAVGAAEDSRLMERMEEAAQQARAAEKAAEDGWAARLVSAVPDKKQLARYGLCFGTGVAAGWMLRDKGGRGLLKR